MTDYRSDAGARFTGAEVYGYLKSGTGTLVRSDEGRRVIEDEAGETTILRKIPGTEQSASGPYIYVADDE